MNTSSSFSKPSCFDRRSCLTARLVPLHNLGGWWAYQLLVKACGEEDQTALQIIEEVNWVLNKPRSVQNRVNWLIELNFPVKLLKHHSFEFISSTTPFLEQENPSQNQWCKCLFLKTSFIANRFCQCYS